MNDKIILITGATSGIGKAAATALAKQGAHVILHGRNRQKTEALKIELIALCGHTRIDTVIADLFLISEVRKMAAELQQRYDRIHILINNAGTMMGNQREVTSEGIEKTIAINLLAPFLLTNLLLPQLSENARVINVASSAHRQNAKPDFEDIESKKNYTPLKTYGNAKLFLILMSQHLARQASYFTVNTLHPGAVATNFSVESNLGWFLNFLSKIARRFFKTAEQGADTMIYLASSAEAEGITGKYFSDRKPAPVNEKYDNRKNEELIWKYCSERVNN